MNIKILDCTIRDGGHLNKWHFDPLCVKSSYFAALKSGADYFEIGYRCPKTVGGLGRFGYCTDEDLFALFPASERCKLTLMIDAGKSDTSLFGPCDPTSTPVRAVRVAAYPYELAKAFAQVEDLKAKGYEVFLNLMASSELNNDQIAELRAWQNKEILEAICFADSFGAFIPSDIPFHVERLRTLGFERIGFHPHNNLQMAFANTLKALDEGVCIVDASIYGMGRGSGNLPIEVLIGYLEKLGQTSYNTVPYLDVIERFYLDLFRDLNWGYKIQSLMGGLKNIHPYYIDDLFRRKTYTVDEIWNALDTIKERCPISYSVEKLEEVLESRFYTPKRSDCQLLPPTHPETHPAVDAFVAGPILDSERYRGRKFLILGSGPSLLRYRDQLTRLIEDENCVTIGVNYLQNLFEPDFHLFVSRMRFLKYASSISPKSTLLVPSFFGRQIVDENHDRPALYFDLSLTDDPNDPPATAATQNHVHLNVAAAAILLAWQMGAREIYAAGLDGYIDERNHRMVYFYNENDQPDDKEIASLRYERFASELDRINRFLQIESVPFSIITPTSHCKYFRNFFGEGDPCA